MTTTMMIQKRGLNRFSKLSDDGDLWAPNNLLKPGAREKHQLNPVGPGNRQEAPAQKTYNEYLYVGAIIESDARPTGVQLKKAA